MNSAKPCTPNANLRTNLEPVSPARPKAKKKLKTARPIAALGGPKTEAWCEFKTFVQLKVLLRLQVSVCSGFFRIEILSTICHSVLAMPTSAAPDSHQNLAFFILLTVIHPGHA